MNNTITQVLNLKQNINNSATIFPSNVVYGNVIIESNINSETEKDLNMVEFKISNNNSNFNQVFSWTLSGTNHILTNRSTGVTEDPARPQFTIHQLGTIAAIENSIEQGIFPRDGFGRDFFKYHWNSQESSATSVNPLGLIYPDGNYWIRSIASDLTIPVTPTHQTSITNAILLDNYRPFIQKVEVFKNTQAGALAYSGIWSFAANLITFTKLNPINLTLKDNLWIKVTTSEPMQNLMLNAFGLAFNNTNITGSSEWWYNVKIEDITTPENTLVFGKNSLDLAGNKLMGFTNTNSKAIPSRNNDGTWPTTATEGDDIVHKVNLGPAYIKSLSIKNSNNPSQEAIFGRSIGSYDDINLSSTNSVLFTNTGNITVDVETSIPLKSLELVVKDELHDEIYRKKISSNLANQDTYSFTIPSNTPGIMLFEFEGLDGSNTALMNLNNLKIAATATWVVNNIVGKDVFLIYNNKGTAPSNEIIESYLLCSNCSSSTSKKYTGYFINRGSKAYKISFGGGNINFPVGVLVKQEFPTSSQKYTIELKEADNTIVERRMIWFQ